MGAGTVTIATRLNPWLTVALALVAPSAVFAQTPGRIGVAAPSRIVVVGAECSSQPLDIGAFAEALRVELLEEGISSIDVGAPEAGVPREAGIATVRLRPDPCDAEATAGEGVLRIEIEDAATSRSLVTTLSISDVERRVRPRVAALVVAERLRAAWGGLSSSSTDTAPVPADSTARPPGRVTAPKSPGQAVTPTPVPTPGAAPPRSDGVSSPGLTLATTLEWRLFSGPGAALLGPRVMVLLPSFQAVPLRFHADAGVAFATVQGSLGDISLTVASGALGIAWIARAGSIRLEVGPKAELGMTAAKGVPNSDSSGVRGSNANPVFATASILASAWAVVAGDWSCMFAIDVGGTLAGLDARADGRPVAEVRGAMLGARVGLGRAF